MEPWIKKSWVGLEFPTWEFQWTFDLRTTRYCNTPKSQLGGIFCQKTWLGRTKQGSNQTGPVFSSSELGVWTQSSHGGNRGEIWEILHPNKVNSELLGTLKGKYTMISSQESRNDPRNQTYPPWKSHPKWNDPNFPTKTFKQIIKFIRIKTLKKKWEPQNMGSFLCHVTFQVSATYFTLVYKHEKHSLLSQ